MKVILFLITQFIGASLLASFAYSEPPSLGSILSNPIKIERDSPVSDIPLSLRNGKIYITAKINNFEGEFVFDTGSPTILDQSIAEHLDLKVIGENTGRDANGKLVTMKIVLVESITLGGTVFRDVPVLLHDYSTVPLGKCYLPNGVIGSELLPGSAWQMDASNTKIKIAASIDDLSTTEELSAESEP